jgi:hypothetical protein
MSRRAAPARLLANCRASNVMSSLGLAVDKGQCTGPGWLLWMASQPLDVKMPSALSAAARKTLASIAKLVDGGGVYAAGFNTWVTGTFERMAPHLQLRISGRSLPY